MEKENVFPNFEKYYDDCKSMLAYHNITYETDEYIIKAISIIDNYVYQILIDWLRMLKLTDQDEILRSSLILKTVFQRKNGALIPVLYAAHQFSSFENFKKCIILGIGFMQYVQKSAEFHKYEIDERLEASIRANLLESTYEQLQAKLSDYLINFSESMMIDIFLSQIYYKLKL